MVIDLKVLVRSFNCESRACYVGNPRESFFFRARESTILFRESFAKVGYYNHYMQRAATHCRPGSGRRRAPENASSSSQVSKSEALRKPNTKAPGLRFSFSAPPADGRGLWIGIFSRKLCERAGESQSACWRGWASKLCKKKLSWEGIPWC